MLQNDPNRRSEKIKYIFSVNKYTNAEKKRKHLPIHLVERRTDPAVRDPSIFPD